MKMKLFLLAALVAFPFTGRAQDDDMYFVPSKKNKTNVESEQVLSREVSSELDSPADIATLCVGKVRDVDEYNRRYTPVKDKESQVVVTDTLGMKWVLTKNDKGDYVWMPADDVEQEEAATSKRQQPAYDDVDDYLCSSRLARFHGYGYPYYYGGWYDPWFYDSWWYYDPWYSYGYYGWGGYYGWHHGWYDPWYYGYGWGPGWYGGWYYNNWYHGGYYGGGIAHNYRRGSSFGHTRGGALASSGRGSTMASTLSRGVGRRSSSDNTYRNTRGLNVNRGSSRSTMQGGGGTTSLRSSSRSGSYSNSSSSSSSRSSSTSRSSSYSGSSSRSSGSSYSGGGSRGGAFSGGGSSRGGGGFSGGGGGFSGGGSRGGGGGGRR